MKIITNLSHRKNQKATISGINVQFDNEGVIEVTKEEAEIIMSKDTSFEVVGESKSKAKDDAKTEEKAEDSGLSELSVSQLKEVAKEAGLDEEVWGKMKKAELVAYLSEQVK